MKAADRMNFYAQQFAVVEMENAYRFAPTPAVAEQWSARTPDGFVFDIPVWSLLTGQPTFPPSLYEDLVPEIREDMRDKPKLYQSHLSSDALEECWTRFRHAVTPLARNGRLGTVILKYPRWFVPRDANREELERVRHRLGDLPASVEFSCVDWVKSEFCEATFNMLEELDFGFVCLDSTETEPGALNTVTATTNDVAVIRMLGRRPPREEGTWTEDWRGYRYSPEDFELVLTRLRSLAGGAKEVHVLFSTCWRDDAVRNGEALRERLGGASATVDLRSAG